LEQTKKFKLTNELWEQDNGTKTIYRSFRQCLGGAARDLWGHINIIGKEEETRDELTLKNYLWELTREMVGLDAYRNQKEYKKKQNLKDYL
jgi:hypothetical protein